MIKEDLDLSNFRNLTAPEIVVDPPGPKVREFMKLGGLRRMRYAQPLMDEAQGIFIKDLDGNTFIDFISGRCVTNIGYSHPRLVKALQTQAAKGTHGLTEHRLKLNKKISEITPGDFKKRIFYAQSGSTTNDFGIKTARWSTKRPYIVAFAGAYHGTTYGALSISSYRPEMVKGFNPNLPGIYHMPYPYCYRCPFKLEHPDCDLACLWYLEDYAFTSYLPPEEVAAVVFEPVAGDAGWHVPPDEWLPTLRKICDRHGILLIAEEVQTGFGRTGKWFAVENWGVEPDIILLGKAIACGVPNAACVVREDLCMKEETGESFWTGGTFSGSPLSSVAALTNIDVIEEEKLVDNSSKMGAYIKGRLMEMMEDHRIMGNVRGVGLLIGVEIVKDKETKKPGVEEAEKICAEAFQKGLYLVNMGAFGTRALRVAPPLIINREQADSSLEILESSISKVENET
jgi:4-aminobutyrate aminotransferase